MSGENPASETGGVSAIEQALEAMPEQAGIYRMLDAKSKVLYVGKAKNLKKRIVNYTHIDRLTPRLQLMVSLVDSLEITTTQTESEALLLEGSLIKSLKPRFNILLRDDKSFPYIAIVKDHKYPRIIKHRGARKKNITYFGPYASAGDVNRAISSLQKSFLLRSCSDNVLAGRTRPCLEYQIKRCSAPCVDKISDEEYTELVKQVSKFLSGKSHEVQAELTEKMEEASAEMLYEKASIYRDRIRALAHIQAERKFQLGGVQDADVAGLYRKGDSYCVQVFFFRGGFPTGNMAFFPLHTQGCDESEVMEAFLSRFYHTHTPPRTLILSHDIYGADLLKESLGDVINKSVDIIIPKRGEKQQVMEIVINNAKEALFRKQQQENMDTGLLVKVADLFSVDGVIKRVEVYDNSHIMGKHAVGAMIVARAGGFDKKSYRTFSVKPSSDNSKPITGGDDFAMMYEVLIRRFRKIKEVSNGIERPDLVLIDGGVGHLSVARKVFNELNITDIPLVCIAKGADRNAGRERFFLPDKEPFTLPVNDPVMHYLQRLRDEAHRFAITTHRAKRARAITHSALDDIPGIGAVKKKALLNHFGSLRGVQEATIKELQMVPGVNKKSAQIIYDYLR